MSSEHVVIMNWKDLAHPDAGGAEVYCANLAIELVASGSRVTFVTSRPRGSARRDTQDGYATRRMGGTFTVYPLALLWLFVHRRRVDAVIDSQNGIPFFAPLAVRRGIPLTLLIHHVHQDQFALYFSTPLATVGRWLEASASRHVYGGRAVCAVSPSTRAQVRSRLKLRGPIYVTPNGCQTRPGAHHVPRAKIPTITCVGRLVAHKRWHLLIDACAELTRRGTPVDLNLLGSGPEFDALAKHAANLGIASQVTLHGFVSDEVRDALLSRAWLTVCTSVGEGWGLSIIEAAAQGVPAVALDVAGLRDSVRHARTGWLADEASLCDALLQALADLAEESTASKMSEECRAWADSLRWSSTADRFRAVLASELARSHRPRTRRPTPSDNAVLVELDHASAARVDTRMLMPTDQLNFCSACVDLATRPLRILLNGADEQDAFTLLERMGLDPQSPDIQVRLCRAHEQVQWHAGTVPHNAPSLLTSVTCPRTPRPTPSHTDAQRVA